VRGERKERYGKEVGKQRREERVKRRLKKVGEREKGRGRKGDKK